MEIKINQTFGDWTVIEGPFIINEKQYFKCALSGIPITMFISLSDKTKCMASLDRINSSIGYISGNVQWVHKDINRMKCDLNQNDFISYCIEITNLHANQQPSLKYI